VREKKVRRRSSISIMAVPSERALCRNLIHTVGDRWTTSVIALSFHGLTRFEQFHRELLSLIARLLQGATLHGAFDR
jgi:DNA-binding HxlR family transcriptional regulator